MAQPSAGAMLDGITIQHAGELLLDVATTADVRRNNATTYIRSAEDLAFALVYFDHLVISDRRMAWQQGQSPGDALLARFPDLVKEIPVAAVFAVADLLGCLNSGNVSPGISPDCRGR
jgi:hypothetical protein